MNPVKKIQVRCVYEKNRPRLRTDTVPAKYVQAPSNWREQCARGSVFTIPARMRADGECWVMQSSF